MRHILAFPAPLTLCFFLAAGCAPNASSDISTSRGDAYVAGMEKVSDMRGFIVRLEESRPVPVYIGLHTWTLSIRTPSGTPVSQAAVRAEPMMLSHGHGTTPPLTFARESASHIGQYALEDLDLFMPGLWTVFITIETEDEVTDVVEFAFELGVAD